MSNLALVILFSLCVLVPSVVFAFGNAASINDLARNPLAAPKIFTSFIVRLIIVEAAAFAIMLYALKAVV